MIDILIALAFAGCIYGVGRAAGWQRGRDDARVGNL